MRTAAGLLLLIGVWGSQAQDEGDTKRCSGWNEFTMVKAIVTALMVKQRAMETEAKELKAELALERTKVAFYAALSDGGLTGPFADDKTLKYSKVFTNVGNAYNNETGLFTAPVNGVYSFHFVAFGSTKCMVRLYVYKNNERIMNNWKHSKKDDPTYVPNSFILDLKEGDTVHFRMPQGACLYDDLNNYSTISGFLL